MHLNFSDQLNRLCEPRVSPKSNVVLTVLILCATVTSATLGYDGSMMNGLNILPSFSDYFGITTTTMSLCTSATYIGGTLAGFTFPMFMNRVSRRSAMFWSSAATLVFIVLQVASVDVAMFIVARIGVGWGGGCSAIAAPAYVAETIPPKHRGWGLGLICDFYYVGALVAAGITYRTADINSTWSWRIPSLVQGVFSLMCIVLLPFLPESPRWLVFEDRASEAKTVLAQIISDGDEQCPEVVAEYYEVTQTIAFEKGAGKQLSFMEMFRSRSARWRLSLVVSSALATVIVGNQIASYYLGPMLEGAGITDTNVQLQVNIVLNAWSLVCALAGTYWAEALGRRSNALISTVMLTIFLYLVGALTKLYGHSGNTSAVYGTVATIFLFMGAYSFGWTPLAYLYPPEVLNYRIRSHGLGANVIAMYGGGLVMVFSIPYALDSLGWKTYLMNASWNVLLIAFIYFFWVETAGKTLEEIDASFGEVVPLDGQDVEAVDLDQDSIKAWKDKRLSG